MRTLLRFMVHLSRFFTVYRSYFTMLFRRCFPRSMELPPAELLRRGSREVQRGHYEAGIALLEQVLEREPANFVAHINVGSAYYLRAQERRRTGLPGTTEDPADLSAAVAADLSAAVRHFEHVLALDPHHVQALLNLAAAYSELDRLEDSIQILQRVLQIHPRCPDCHYNLATAYLRQGDRERAREELRKELEVNPHSPHAPELLRELEARGRS
jgi:tetratricopeptide (TPR) repeat protein